MKRQRTTFEKYQRNIRLMLSDFFHLFTPGKKKVYTWKEILIGSLILTFLVLLASLTTR